MAAQLLSDQLDGCRVAFSKENPVIITTSPLTGTGAPASSRFDIATLSPKDNRPTISNCGGDFGVWLKKAGYDALILNGQSDTPCWIEISEDHICFHEDTDLWGAETSACRTTLADHLGSSSFGSLCIGPAGENLVPFASVMSNSHTAGRAGIGAVLGWKKVKAIAVTGSKPIPVFDPEMLNQQSREWYAFLKSCSNTSQDPPVCTGCPLRCQKHAASPEDQRLDELGLDAIAAKEAVLGAKKEGLSAESLYEQIAYQTGIGAQLEVPVSSIGKKSGDRRGNNYRTIARTFSLPETSPRTIDFCKALTEAISLMGQCIFLANSFSGNDPLCHLQNTYFAVTGKQITLDDLLQLGQRSLELQRQLYETFQ